MTKRKICGTRLAEGTSKCLVCGATVTKSGEAISAPTVENIALAQKLEGDAVPEVSSSGRQAEKKTTAKNQRESAALKNVHTVDTPAPQDKFYLLKKFFLIVAGIGYFLPIYQGIRYSYYYDSSGTIPDISSRVEKAKTELASPLPDISLRGSKSVSWVEVELNQNNRPPLTPVLVENFLFIFSGRAPSALPNIHLLEPSVLAIFLRAFQGSGFRLHSSLRSERAPRALPIPRRVFEYTAEKIWYKSKVQL